MEERGAKDSFASAMTLKTPDRLIQYGGKLLHDAQIITAVGIRERRIAVGFNKWVLFPRRSWADIEDNCTMIVVDET